MSDLKRAVIISTFFRNGWDIRTKYLIEYFQELGYRTLVLTSDFDHREKQYIEINKSHVKALHAKPYYKNLSFARINSHIDFSKNAFNAVKKISPDLIYVSGPPNYLYHEAAAYKKNHPECKIAFEIGDMWPETMPVNDNIKKIAGPVFSLWAHYRNASLPSADIVIYECNLFKNALEKYRPNKINETIYLCKEDSINGELTFNGPREELGFAYVGTINNIINIDLIVNFLSKLNKKRKARLEIIGNGEMKEKLIEKIKENAINVIDHGIIYDDQEKGRILRNCQFGINIMKPTVMVGATMKSLEYFHWGLGLINNIKADTWDLVDKYHCGINIAPENMDSQINAVSKLTNEEIGTMEKNSRDIFEKKFDEKVIKEKYLNLFRGI